MLLALAIYKGKTDKGTNELRNVKYNALKTFEYGRQHILHSHTRGNLFGFFEVI